MEIDPFDALSVSTLRQSLWDYDYDGKQRYRELARNIIFDPARLAEYLNSDDQVRAEVYPGSWDFYYAVFEELLRMVDLLDVLYDGLALAGKYSCDDFHDEKLGLRRWGERYGYIGSYVRQENGSNQYRFYQRRPNDGMFVRTAINPRKTGYSHSQFKRFSSSEGEYWICAFTEAKYQRLREMSHLIKDLRRQINRHKKQFYRTNDERELETFRGR